MCGIAGYKIHRHVADSPIKRMVDALVHRGPDSDGFFSSNGYCGGMRRLSINGVNTGSQPLFSEDKNVVLLYNGEIYNYLELRRDLEKKGKKFKTNSDGEVICHLYEYYGEELFSKLNGMYSVALWLEKEKKLILARDIPGEKPLYYYLLSNNEIVFSSEIQSLTKFPGLSLEINTQSLWDLPTFTWIPQPETVFKSIKSLDSGSILIVDNDGVSKKKIDFNSSIDVDINNENELIEYTREIVIDSINNRLISDVPVGCFLSGGIDSSIVSAIASKSIEEMNTFTIGFGDIDDPYGHGKSDESGYSSKFAKQLGTVHHNVYADASLFKTMLYDFVKYADQPFAVPSGLGIMAISKVASDIGVKVLLSGDCADECFGGYSWYPYLNSSYSKRNESNSNFLDKEVTFSNYGIEIAERVDILNRYTPQKRALSWHYYASELEKDKLFNKDFFSNVLSSERHFYDFNSSSLWSPEDFIAQDRNFYLKNEMLQKLDRMTMAKSVEGRVPFCSQEILQLSDKLSYHHMVRNGETKWLLKKAFEGIIPDEIIYRKKHGFNVPIDNWLRNEWSDLFEQTFSSDSKLMTLGIINKKTKNVALDMISNKDKQNGPTIFSLVTLNLWLENLL
jgi:asparagine synthase (glutamine-hydrolysing)